MEKIEHVNAFNTYTLLSYRQPLSLSIASARSRKRATSRQMLPGRERNWSSFLRRLSLAIPEG